MGVQIKLVFTTSHAMLWNSPLGFINGLMLLSGSLESGTGRAPRRVRRHHQSAGAPLAAQHARASRPASCSGEPSPSATRI